METREHPIDETRRPGEAGASHKGTDLRQEVLRLALPAILEMTAHMSIWMVDTAMVGRLGPEALSAVGMAGQVFWTITWVFGALGTGTVALAARAFGAGDKEETSRLASESMTVAAVVSVLLFAALRGAAGPASDLVAMSGVVRGQMREYIRILSYAAPAILLHLTGTAVLRATGDTRTPLIISGLSNSFNALGDWALIFGNLGFPRLEVRGAAIASAASFALGSAVVLFVLACGRNGVRLRFPSTKRWRWETARRLVTLSAPASLETLLMDGARSAQMFTMTALGDIGFAAHQVAVSCESLSFMPGYGFAIASSIMVGQSLGAGEACRARAGALECLRMAMFVMGTLGVLFLIIPQSLVSLFASDSRVVSQAAIALRTAGLFQIVLAVTEVLAGALRGSGDTRTPLKITTMGAWLLRIPLTYLAVRVMRFPLTAVWLVNGFDWVVRASAVTIAFRAGRWARTGTLVRPLQDRA